MNYPGDIKKLTGDKPPMCPLHKKPMVFAMEIKEHYCYVCTVKYCSEEKFIYMGW